MRDVAGAEVGGKFACIDLVLERDLDGVASEGDGANRGDFGVDSTNAGHEKVSRGEVESSGVNES